MMLTGMYCKIMAVMVFPPSHFSIIIDAGQEIEKSDEENNEAPGKCIG
jgi:subtilase family serine protease